MWEEGSSGPLWMDGRPKGPGIWTGTELETRAIRSVRVSVLYAFIWGVTRKLFDLLCFSEESECIHT
jgi:hypothetical protein